jgi:O-antigen ligase
VLKKTYYLYLLPFTILVSTIPFIIYYFTGGTDVRVVALPIFYLIFTVIFTFFFLFKYLSISSLSIPNKELIIFLAFIFYILCNSFLRGYSSITITYIFAWVANFWLYIASFSFYRAMGFDFFMKSIQKVFYAVIILFIIGLLKKYSGISPDVNFIPTLNRNGAAVFIVLVLPLFYALYDFGYISRKMYTFFVIITVLFLVSLASRNGMISAIFSVFYYYRGRLFSNSYFYFSIVTGVLVVLFSDGLVDGQLARLENAFISAYNVVFLDGIEAGKNDYQRYMLLKSSLKITHDNFLFGTGVGLFNYKLAFHESVDFFYRDSKSHNFYLSYFSELGLFGFSILIAIFYIVYKRLKVVDQYSRPFLTMFFTLAISMMMSEYILMPYIWFIFGASAGALSSLSYFNGK